MPKQLSDVKRHNVNRAVSRVDEHENLVYRRHRRRRTQEFKVRVRANTHFKRAIELELVMGNKTGRQSTYWFSIQINWLY